MDEEHKRTDRELKRLERRLKTEYRKAGKEIREKASAYFAQFREEDHKRILMLNRGEITEAEYLAWRRDNMATGERYNALVRTLSEDLTHTNQIASGMINKSLPPVYANNYNFGAYEVCEGLDMNLAFDLIDHSTVERIIRDNPRVLPKSRVDIPKDLAWNQRKIRSALLQGILQGDSIPKLANRLQSVTNMSSTAAIRNARTMTTSAENAGRMDRYAEAKKIGVDLEKTWIATLDARTRDAHIELDGVTIDTDAEFENAIGTIRFPGDPEAKPANVYNCRCTLVSNVKGIRHDLSIREMGKGLEGMTYEEWKAQPELHRQEKEQQKTIEPVKDQNIKLKGLDDMAVKEFQSGVNSVLTDFGVDIHSIEYDRHKNRTDVIAQVQMGDDGQSIVYLSDHFLDYDDAYKTMAKNASNALETNMPVFFNGVHEAGHILEIELCPYMKNDIMSSNLFTDEVVELAQRNLRARGLSGAKSQISEYATRDNHETIAEAMVDYYNNGGNATPLSLEIYDILKAVIQGRWNNGRRLK